MFDEVRRMAAAGYGNFFALGLAMSFSRAYVIHSGLRDLGLKGEDSH